jgi:hypothetical protein
MSMMKITEKIMISGDPSVLGKYWRIVAVLIKLRLYRTFVFQELIVKRSVLVFGVENAV